MLHSCRESSLEYSFKRLSLDSCKLDQTSCLTYISCSRAVRKPVTRKWERKFHLWITYKNGVARDATYLYEVINIKQNFSFPLSLSLFKSLDGVQRRFFSIVKDVKIKTYRKMCRRPFRKLRTQRENVKGRFSEIERCLIAIFTFLSIVWTLFNFIRNVYNFTVSPA